MKDELLKICIACGRKLLESNFSLDPGEDDGRLSRCKICEASLAGFARIELQADPVEEPQSSSEEIQIPLFTENADQKITIRSHKPQTSKSPTVEVFARPEKRIKASMTLPEVVIPAVAYKPATRGRPYIPWTPRMIIHPDVKTLAAERYDCDKSSSV